MKLLEFSEMSGKESVLNLLQEQGVYLPAYCGGNGKCGKCLVHFLGNIPKITNADRRFLSEKQLEDGWRLSCTAFVKGAVRIELPEEDEEEEMVVAAGFQSAKKEENVATMISDSSSAQSQSMPEDNGVDFRKDNRKNSGDNTGKNQGNNTGNNPEKNHRNSTEENLGQGYIVAVDIGTTTIAASLVDSRKGEVLRNATGVNHQRVYGADVISRMQASNEGKGPLLQKLIMDDLKNIAAKLGVDAETIPIIISGNSTMEHLLQGLSCQTLGVAPYRPVDISLHDYHNMTILPGISTFVGADIVSGMIACGMDQSEEISLFIDLGTNGEIAIGNKDHILVTSTAAGPVFEGGSIICGVAGIPGAISRVKIEAGKVLVETIGDAKAIGICGTGVLEAVFELLDNEIMDESGALEEPYDEDGFVLCDDISIYAKDIREVQLAKSAIRAGTEVLIREYGIEAEDIAHVYLAGGFGQKIDVRKAVGIGLLPEEIEDRVAAVGNSSLAGAIMLAEEPSLKKRFERLAGESVEISLAESKLFNELYIDYMFFDE